MHLMLLTGRRNMINIDVSDMEWYKDYRLKFMEETDSTNAEIIGLMTTHDYALCDEAQTELKNVCYYHFSETYDDEGINFDYKLKDGVSNISNAKYLMKLVGIII